MAKKIIAGIFSICLIISVFVTAIDISCFNRSFYAREYTKLNTASDIGVSEEALDNMTDTLLDYLKDKRDDLGCVEEVNGIQREIFNKREKDHMIDVKNLYLSVIAIRNIAAVVCILSLIYLLYSHSAGVIPAVFKNTGIVFAMVIAVLAIYAASDFDTFWTQFHHVFFPMNDLWLLDPRTDILIMMVPSEFFFDLVMKIVINSAAGGVICATSVYLLGKLSK